jgi:uncharacterized membrane protein
LRSGLTIGRSVVGSQTTTLLLAYGQLYFGHDGEYGAGHTFLNIFNSKMVAAEILHTFVGCIGTGAGLPLHGSDQRRTVYA